MNARQLIEAEDPKRILRQARSTPRIAPDQRLYFVQFGPASELWAKAELAPVNVYDDGQAEFTDGLYDLTKAAGDAAGGDDERYTRIYQSYSEVILIDIKRGQTEGVISGPLGPYKWRLLKLNPGAEHVHHKYIPYHSTQVLAKPQTEAEDPKKFLQQAPKAQFEVDSAWQSWAVDGMGNVLYDMEARHPRRVVMRSIKRFNVEEYRQRLGRSPSGQVPLADISYWDHAGAYHPCVAETYRAHLLRPRQEGEDPKSVFRELNRPFGVSIDDISHEYRPDAPYPEMFYAAQWKTPFLIKHRRRIRGCPAGTGRTLYAAIRELVDITNKESKTKFFFNFQGGYTAPAQEAQEDPKQAFKARFPVTPWPDDPIVKQTFDELGLADFKKRDGQGERGSWTEYYFRKDLGRRNGRQYTLSGAITVWQPQPRRVYVSVSKGYGDQFGGPWVELFSVQTKDLRSAMQALRYAISFIVSKVDFLPPKQAKIQATAMTQRWLASRQESEDPKSFLSRHAPAARFEVEGTYFTWTVDGQTGKVIQSLVTSPRARMRAIDRFNVEEYRERNGKWPTGTVDINQISYWTKPGNYFISQAEITHATRPRPRQEAEDPKAFLKTTAARRHDHQVVAQSCEFRVDGNGNVIEFTPNYPQTTEDYDEIQRFVNIAKFDFDEYEKYWGDIPQGIDISDVGFWFRDGTYEPPNEQYRQDIKSGGIAR